MNYYKLLQVDASADNEIIEMAYKKLAKKYHPDICKENDALEMMRNLNEAYDVLSVPSLRNQYDIQLSYRSQLNNTSFSVKSNKLKMEDDCLVQAQQILGEYFDAIIRKDFYRSYHLVNPKQREWMTLSAYKNWQHWTSRVYDLIDYRLSLKEYIEDEMYNRIFAKYRITFNVDVVEYNQIMEHFERGHFIKHVIIFDNRPYVYLDQIEVSDIIKRYEKLAKLKVGKWQPGKNKLTFNVSKNELLFYSQLENEFERFHRYEIPFSLVFLKIANAEQRVIQDITNELRKIISEHLRKLDIFVLINKHTFMILLPCTRLHESKIVAEKICEIATSSQSLMMYSFTVKRIIIENEIRNYDEIRKLIQQIITEINLDEVKT